MTISEFLAAVRTAVAELTEDHGYSRERAVGAILRELTQGQAPLPDEKVRLGLLNEWS